MSIFFKIILVVLIFLATSSGITKIMLMQQDVEFFGKYGFTNTLLVVFGAAQLIGGILLIIQKARFIGAAIVAVTFLISAVLLIMDNNIPVTIVTFIAVAMLGLVMKQSLNNAKPVSS